MKLAGSHLTFFYPGKEQSPVIKDLSFSMEQPGFKALFGPSGTGKTSLAKMISFPGMMMAGDIHTQGIEKILYSYNLERLPGWSSTGKHLNKVTPEGKHDLKNTLVDIFELGPVLNSRFSQLSMGQQNRINLIRYLLQDFDLLILDESLANVDEKLRENIILAVKELFSDKMFLYISHNLMEVAKFCGQILIFGKSSQDSPYSMKTGLDCRKKDELDKDQLDQVMLEIMNAF